MGEELQLKSGARIAIVGAGPAGSFFAIFSKKIAREKNMDIDITIYDGKDFLLPGPSGCNLCAGIISESMIHALDELGIGIPDLKIQSRVTGYYIEHLAGRSFIEPPRDCCKIYTVFRGNGPRFASVDGNISFDDHLLQFAKKLGVKVVHANVSDIHLSKNPKDPVVITFIKNATLQKTPVDFAVGAFGLNSTLVHQIQKQNFGYRPPKTLTTYHAELFLHDNALVKDIQNKIGVFSINDFRKLRFGIVTPKGDYLTVSIVGKSHVQSEDMERFLDHPRVHQILQKPDVTLTPSCHCRAKIPIGPSKKPFTNRFVIIGDASFSRHFKNGIYSAFLTAKFAAHSAFHYGISERDFRKGYYRMARRTIIADNRLGRLLLFISLFCVRKKNLASAYSYTLERKLFNKLGYILELFSWNMLTGEISYKQILRILTSANLRLEISYSLARFLKSASHKKHLVSKKTSIKIGSENFGRIKEGDLIAIVGGGPAGVGCAIALKNLARQSGMNIKVRVYEAKSIDGVPRYNQCVGVLSPPIKDILKNLGVNFPDHLIQKTIKGYYLHTDNRDLLLDEESEPSLAVRRITFDHYLIEESRHRDVEIVESRVTGVEFHNDYVTLYSESDNIRATAVIGAFGLDDGSALMFSRESRYGQPKFLSSIVTKWHPDANYMQKFGDHVHAILPSLREIEFGAVTPKQNHLTINIAGENVDANSMDWFLSSAPVTRLLTSSFLTHKGELSYFKGKFPISIAKGMFGHRYITVGDAAGLVRPFKGKGINSALLSGSHAANVIIKYGVSDEAFLEYKKLNNEVLSDLPYGKAIRIMVKSFGYLHLLDFLVLLGASQTSFRKALYSSVSANKPYRIILGELLNWTSIKQAIKLVEEIVTDRSLHVRNHLLEQ